MKDYGQRLKAFWKEEDGIGTIEILLIVAVVVIIAVMFRDKITGWVTSMTDRTGSQIDEFVCPNGKTWDTVLEQCK